MKSSLKPCVRYFSLYTCIRLLYGTAVIQWIVLIRQFRCLKYDLCHQIFNPRLHRYEHYYKCAGFSDFFCTSTMLSLEIIFKKAVVSKEVLNIVIYTSIEL